MTNPCNECIVKIMCDKPCDDLKDFVYKYLTNARNPTLMMECHSELIERVSFDLMFGKVILCNNSWGYRFIK